MCGFRFSSFNYTRYVIVALVHLTIFFEMSLETSLPVIWLAMCDEVPLPGIKGLIGGGLFWGMMLGCFTGLIFQITNMAVTGFILFGFTCSAVLGLVLPSLIMFTPQFAVLVTFVQGFFHVIISAALFKILPYWTPDSENTIMTAILFSGHLTGSVGATLLSSIIAKTIHWSAPSVIFGSLLIVSTALLLLLKMTDKPEDHILISLTEREYIINNRKLCTKETDEKDNGGIIKALMALPWKNLLTSLPVISNVLVRCSRMSTITFFLFIGIKYLRQVIGVSVVLSETIMSLQFCVAAVSGILTSWIFDFLRRKEILSTTIVRKVGVTIGMTTEVVGFSILCREVQQTEVYISYVFIAVGLGILDTHANGNSLDLAPRYTNMMFTISIILSTFLSASMIHVVRKIVPESGWQCWVGIFSGLIAFKLFSVLFFMIFGSGELQSWNDDDT